MDAAVQSVREAARVSRLLPTAHPVLVLLSGGRDSVCLLDVACQLSGTAAVRALHVDYGLRADSGIDADHCRRLCEDLGVALEVLRAPRAPASGQGNVQAWARDLRYAEAARLVGRCQVSVAVGHTASDQAETVLYRLAASPGRRALVGMAAERDGMVRPLLQVTREQTGAYCRARGLTWRDDESNDCGRFARTRVRHGLIGALESIHPAAQANVARTAALLREEGELLDGLVDDVLDGVCEISLERLASMPRALGRLVAMRLAEQAARRPVPAAGRRLEELLALAAHGASGALDLGGARALVEYGILRMVPTPPGPRGAGLVPAFPGPSACLRVPGRARLGEWEISSRLLAVPSARRRLHERPELAGALDAAAVSGDLIVRAWRAGDRVACLGRTGTHTVADLFAERRVPRWRRSSYPVVEVAGAIAWVPGVATAGRFALGRRGRAVWLRARTAANVGDVRLTAR